MDKQLAELFNRAVQVVADVFAEQSGGIHFRHRYKHPTAFGSHGGGKVGAMRSASQGSFNIYSDSGSSSDDDYDGTYDKSTVGKQVRLVVTIEYAID